MANQLLHARMQNNPWSLVVMILVGAYVAKLWWDDLQAAKGGRPNPRALPGAASASARAMLIAATGGVLIVAAETWGELALGVSGKQSTLTGLFAVYTLVAAIIEEVVFRGYIVIDKRGRAALWTSVVGASVLFAALHPFLWKWDGGMPWADGHVVWTLGAKGAFSTLAVLVASLWFYYVRFAAFNRQHSLLPCFVAHGAKNLSVIVVKACQGYLVGWY